MEFYNNEEVCFQQIKRTAKMMIGQEDIDNIKYSGSDPMKYR